MQNCLDSKGMVGGFSGFMLSMIIFSLVKVTWMDSKPMEVIKE